MTAKKHIDNNGEPSQTHHTKNINAEQLDLFINSILQAKSLDEAIDIVNNSIYIEIVDDEMAKLHNISDLKLKSTQMLLVILINYIISTQIKYNKEHFEMTLLNNVCSCSEH